MRFVLLSDTHERHAKVTVPDGDVLIHAGDLTMVGHGDAYEDVFAWLEKFPHKHKVIIPGNHDFAFQHHVHRLKPNLTILLDTEATIEGFKFYGSPFTPTFGRWAFMMDRGETIYQHWLKIPHDTDVLITHGPPYDVLDRPHPSALPCGCEDLRWVVGGVTPQMHVFGHIHGGYGHQQHGYSHFVNASVVDEAYQPVNQPIVLDLEPREKP